MRGFWVILIAFWGLSACSGEWQSYPAVAPDQAHVDTIVHVSDTLVVSVFDDADLSKDYNVDGNGAITMPLIGAVQVVGLSAANVRDVITARLTKGGYLVNPDVTVVISKTRHFMIMGEVMNAGEYPYRDGMTLLDAVAKAGGFSYRAQQTQFDVVRKNKDGTENQIDAALSTKIAPSDVIRVRERFF